MDTMSPEEFDVAGPPPGDAAPRRRRQVRPLTIVLAVLVIAGALYAANNERVIASARMRVGPTRHGPVALNGSTVTIRKIETFRNPLEYALSYEPGAEFEFGFNLAVDGSKTVTVLSVEPAQPYGVDLTGRFLGRGNFNELMGASPTAGVTAFRPFTLKPGEFRWVEFRYKSFDCGPTPAVGVRSRGNTTTIRFRVNGRHRTNYVYMRFSLAFVGFPSCKAYASVRQERRRAGRPETVTDDAVGISGLPRN